MASYNELNALIDAYINRNGVQAITGQILNGVLKAMVEQLGRGYTIMGAAIPATDPGTPDGPECYFASTPGTYTDFNGLQVVPGELALLCYTPTDGWTKATIYEGFQEVGATIDGNVGTPSVGVSYANGVLSFDFHNMKGNTGDPAGFGTIGATVDGNIGTPGVTVQTSGPDTAKNLTFAFTNLKGETGVTSVVATVDNTSGTPSCAVSLQGQQLTLAFTGLKGAQGDTGSSVDYPFTIVNNLTTDDATQALSAAQGVVLDGKVSQLEAKVTDLYSDAILQNARIGNWSISGVGYAFSANTKRVAVGEFLLTKDSIIRMLDGTKCRMYIGWGKDDGTFGSSNGWKTADYTVPSDGVYVICLEGIPAMDLTSIDELTRYIRIETSKSNLYYNYAQRQKILPCIPGNGSGYIDYNTTTKHIVIPASALATILGSWQSNMPSSADLDLSSKTGSVIVVANLTTNTYAAYPYTHTLANDEIFICGVKVRTLDTTIASVFPWSIDGIPYGQYLDYSTHFMVPSTGREYCDYNTETNIFTIPKDAVIFGIRFNSNGTGNDYAIPQKVEVDLSVTGASAVLVVFNKTTKAFSVKGYNVALTKAEIPFACIRKGEHGPGGNFASITCLHPWSVNGYPYGITKVPGMLKKKGYTKGINHRGYSPAAPENTIPAFRRSAQEGFDYVETDVQFTSDGVAVLLHDTYINRVARNADGTELSSTVYIADITYAQALEYDFGIFKGDDYEGTKIATFQEFIALCRNLGLHPYIELKAGTQQQIEALVELVHNYGMDGKCTWIGYGTDLLGCVVGKDEYARIGMTRTPTALNVNDIRTVMTGKNEVFFDSSVYTDTEIDICKNAGIPLEVWTINSKDTILSLPPYISGVTSDSLDASVILLES